MTGGTHDLARSIRQFQEYLEKAGLDKNFATNITNSLNSMQGTASELNGRAQEAIALGNQFLPQAEGINSSLGGLLKVAADLASPAKIFMYGSAGALVGIAIMQAIKLKADLDRNVILQNILHTNYHHIMISTQNLRFTAGLLIAQYATSKTAIGELDQEALPLMDRLFLEAKEVIKDTSPITVEKIRLMEALNALNTELLKNYYVTHETGSDMSSRLDCATLANDYSSAFNAVHDRDPKGIPVNSTELNIYVLRNLYGTEAINAIIRNLSEKMKSQSAEFENDVSYYNPNPSQGLSATLAVMLNAWLAGKNVLEALPKVLHENVQNFLNTFEITEDVLPSNITAQDKQVLQNMPIAHKQLLVARSLLTYAPQGFENVTHKNPEHWVRMVRHGAYDMVATPIALFTDPVGLVRGVYHAITHLDEVVSNMGTMAVNQPLRIVTSLAITAGVSTTVSSIARNFRAPPPQISGPPPSGSFPGPIPGNGAASLRVVPQPYYPSATRAAASTTSTANYATKATWFSSYPFKNAGQATSLDEAETMENRDADEIIQVGDRALSDNLNTIHQHMIDCNDPNKWPEILLDEVGYSPSKKKI